MITRSILLFVVDALGPCLKDLMNIVEFARETKNLGQEDPRRIIHSLKVGLAITLISLFYYFEPLYDGFGVSAMWAVMTVVLVFDFSVGMVFCFFPGSCLFSLWIPFPTAITMFLMQELHLVEV